MNNEIKEFANIFLREYSEEDISIEAIMEKFGTALIKECIKEVYPIWLRREGFELINLSDAVTRVKERFGIK